MTEKEKAKELVDKFYALIPSFGGKQDACKDCAIIAVNEIIDIYDLHNIGDEPSKEFIYWYNVKKEINLL